MIRDVSIDLMRGEVLGVVKAYTTRVGAGTFPTELLDADGEHWYRIDGVDHRDIKLESLRRNIGVVFQDSTMFYRSIADNLRIGKPDATQAELEEAAKVDGSSSFQTLRSIFLPLALPGIVTVGLFAFIASWNEFLSALIFMNKETSFTVPIMLISVRSGRLGAVDWGALQAGVILSILPCVIIYLLLQKYYVAGFLNGAVK